MSEKTSVESIMETVASNAMASIPKSPTPLPNPSTPDDGSVINEERAPLETVETLGARDTQQASTLMRDKQILDGLNIDRGNWQGGLSALASGDPIGLESWNFGALADGSPAASMKSADGEDIVVKLPPSVWMSVVQNRSASRIQMQEHLELKNRTKAVQDKIAATFRAAPDLDPVMMEGLASLAEIDPDTAMKLYSTIFVSMQKDGAKQLKDGILNLNIAANADSLKKQFQEIYADQANKSQNQNAQDRKTDPFAINESQQQHMNDVRNAAIFLRPNKNNMGIFDTFAGDPETMDRFARLASSGLYGAKIEPPEIRNGQYRMQDIMAYAQKLDRFAGSSFNGWEPSNLNNTYAMVQEMLVTRANRHGTVLMPDQFGNLNFGNQQQAMPVAPPVAVSPTNAVGTPAPAPQSQTPTAPSWSPPAPQFGGKPVDTNKLGAYLR